MFWVLNIYKRVREKSTVRRKEDDCVYYRTHTLRNLTQDSENLFLTFTFNYLIRIGFLYPLIIFILIDSKSIEREKK